MKTTRSTINLVIGLGAGGHAKVMIEALLLSGHLELVGLLDANEKLHGTKVLGLPVLGNDSLLSSLRAKGITCFFVGIGSVGDAQIRRRVFHSAIQNGLEPVNVIHPAAIVSTSASVGHGTVILAGAVVNADAQLAVNVIVNTGSIVEHDCIVGAHAHIATGARLGGDVTVGEGAHVGIGASVLNGIHIGQRAIVGAGAVVVKDVPEGVVVAGVPARILRRIA